MLIRLFIFCAVMAGFAVGMSELASQAGYPTHPDRASMECSDFTGTDCGGPGPVTGRDVH